MFPSKSSLLLSAILLISLLTGVQAAPSQRDFVRASGSQFQLNGHEYKAMGFTSYQLCVAKNKTSRAEVQRIFRAAKAAGFSLFRATSIVYDFNDGDLNHHLSEPVWQRIDLLLDVARQENIKVILDFSTLTYETGRSSQPPFDVTDPGEFRPAETDLPAHSQPHQPHQQARLQERSDASGVLHSGRDRAVWPALQRRPYT